jgi:hypothetical protein
MSEKPKNYLLIVQQKVSDEELIQIHKLANLTRYTNGNGNNFNPKFIGWLQEVTGKTIVKLEADLELTDERIEETLLLSWLFYSKYGVLYDGYNLFEVLKSIGREDVIELTLSGERVPEECSTLYTVLATIKE